MPLATITSKGQVTIPKAVRDSLRLDAGDRIEFVLAPGGEVLIRPISRKVDDVFGRLHRPGRRPVATEEMDEAIARRMKAGAE